MVGFAQWSTSCLNLLDKLSISTNRFVTQFEVWAVGGPGKKMNIGSALGVLKSARHEYSCGLAIEYNFRYPHLSSVASWMRPSTSSKRAIPERHPFFLVLHSR